MKLKSNHTNEIAVICYPFVTFNSSYFDIKSAFILNELSTLKCIKSFLKELNFLYPYCLKP